VNTPEVRFLTGSQHLYGADALAEVDRHSQQIVQTLDAAGKLPGQGGVEARPHRS
jgi:L-arabinose isomerase